MLHTDALTNFFSENKSLLTEYRKINEAIQAISGINDFFQNQEDTILFENEAFSIKNLGNGERREYGDFQTNSKLADSVAKYALSRFGNVEFVLEPTCGKGNFILAALSECNEVKKIVGIEIYKPYVLNTKLSILDFFLNNPDKKKPVIDIIHANTFEFDFSSLSKETKRLKTLVIGNPPWVTNSELGAIGSDNLPKKSNHKKNKGLDAMTGKGNFDIGEYVTCEMLKNFERHEGVMAFLVKNSVIKNIVNDQKINKFKIGGLSKLTIDSKKEFDASVNASLFYAQLNNGVSFRCKELDFYSQEEKKRFGWSNDKFVSSIEDYQTASSVDGKSPFVWRSGVKHDCSKVMELNKENEYYSNRIGDKIKIEKALIYGLIKSSDLKGGEVGNPRKFTIITQSKIGQETKYISEKYPLTYKYLDSKKEYFEKRKSSIYKDKPPFSIFGIGDYSFAKYKVAISGLYKSTFFTLVPPFKSKPLMLDDTCYFIGFDNLRLAEIAQIVLNSPIVQKFIKSIVFSDAKRSINKETLMRIDFDNAMRLIDFQYIQKKLRNVELKEWEAFKKIIKKDKVEQLALF